MTDDDQQVRKVFMIGPIGTAGTEQFRVYRQALTYVVKKALPESNWHVTRADDESAPDSITSRIVRSIIEADLVVADLTDQNPNVFYELAVAHGHHKPVVHIIAKGQTPPFDVKDQRAVSYDLADPESVDDAIRRVRDAADHAVNSGEVPDNPQSGYDLFKTISGGDNPTAVGQEVAEALEALTTRMSRLERGINTLVANRRSSTVTLPAANAAWSKNLKHRGGAELSSQQVAIGEAFVDWLLRQGEKDEPSEAEGQPE